MCQAYEGEARAIVSSEAMETVRGFAAAFANKPIDVNPHIKYGRLFGYERDAWDHGGRCFQEGLLPHPVVRLYTPKPGEQDASKVFKETNVLPADLAELLSKTF